jgi:hypothetical protein
MTCATGPAGSQGPRGFNGTNGLTGPQGPAGLQGPAGSQGPRGFNGTNGLTGPQGPAGPIGQTGATGPAGSQGPAGPGHVSFYTIPIGHDGWTLSTASGGGGPSFTPGGVGPAAAIISGPDLTNITTQSVVMAHEINTGVTSVGDPSETNGIASPWWNEGPDCHTWDPFQNGFHVYCFGGGNPNTTELRVAVLNP